MKVIISAAGTGGHINPGIAIANKIKEKEPDSEIIFIGTNRGLEIDLVPRAGYKLKTIDVYGFKKEFSIQNLKHILKTIFTNIFYISLCIKSISCSKIFLYIFATQKFIFICFGQKSSNNLLIFFHSSSLNFSLFKYPLCIWQYKALHLSKLTLYLS